MIDINELGTVYKVMEKSTGEIRDLQIIFLENFLELIGTYDPNHFPHFDEYMQDCCNAMQGFVPDIQNITWYARKEDDMDFLEAIYMACAEDNKLIIIETLPEDD